MERYFEKFRLVSYANTVVRDITQRAVVLNSVYNDPLLYYPYDVEQGERPDMIADRYYSDQYMAWLLYLSNRVVDPYHDWYVDQATFESFIVKKYGSLASAVTKVKYYRNNWYSDPSPTISAAAYDSLLPNVARFYEPVPINGIVTASPRQYSRRQVDWKLETNAVASYAVANGAGFSHDEVVDVKFGVSQTGTGQVASSNSTVVTLKNLSGTVTTGTISGSSHLTGRESGANSVFTSATSVANCIPAGETNFWSPVTYYDYENEINERNKSVYVMRSEFAGKASRQLTNLLKQ